MTRLSRKQTHPVVVDSFLLVASSLIMIVDRMSERAMKSVITA